MRFTVKWESMRLLSSIWGHIRLLRVIPKQALADDLEKSGYKTKQIRASTTRQILILLIVIIKFIEF